MCHIYFLQQIQHGLVENILGHQLLHHTLQHVLEVASLGHALHLLHHLGHQCLFRVLGDLSLLREMTTRRKKIKIFHSFLFASVRTNCSSKTVIVNKMWIGWLSVGRWLHVLLASIIPQAIPVGKKKKERISFGLQLNEPNQVYMHNSRTQK